MSMFSTSPRRLYLALFVVCAGLLGFGLYLQHVVGLEPCPMCIMQRYAFVAIAAVALLAALHGPGRAGSIVYGLTMLLLALVGGGVAVRQSWIQRWPVAEAECGPGLEYMLDSYGLAESLPMIFRGAGDCTAIDWTFLGLSIANWSVLCFAAVVAFSVQMMRKGGRRPRWER